MKMLNVILRKKDTLVDWVDDGGESLSQNLKLVKRL